MSSTNTPWYRRQRNALYQSGCRSGRQGRSKKQARQRPVVCRAGQLRPLSEIFTVRNVVTVYEQCRRDAGPGAGVDGVTWDDLSRSEVFRLAEIVCQTVLGDDYRPRKTRSVKIPKPGSTETRELKLRTIADRLIARVAAMALTPYLDVTFSDISYAYRPGRSLEQLLANVEYDVEQEGRFFIWTADLRKAFDNVRIDQTLQACRELIPDANWLRLINQLLRGHAQERRITGFDQGCPLSPLAFNMFADRFIDKVIEQLGANCRVYRFSDNIIVTASSLDELRQFARAVVNILRPTGLTFKGSEHELNITDLRETSVVELGFQLSCSNNQLKLDTPFERFDNLNQQLRAAHQSHDPRLSARQIVRGWINSLGPALDRFAETILPVIQRSLKETCFLNLIPETQLLSWVQKARNSWNKTRLWVYQSRREAPGPRSSAACPVSMVDTLYQDNQEKQVQEEAAAPRRRFLRTASAGSPPSAQPRAAAAGHTAAPRADHYTQPAAVIPCQEPAYRALGRVKTPRKQRSKLPGVADSGSCRRKCRFSALVGTGTQDPRPPPSFMHISTFVMMIHRSFEGCLRWSYSYRYGFSR